MSTKEILSSQHYEKIMRIPSRMVVLSAQTLQKWWAIKWTGNHTQIKSSQYLLNTFDTEIKIETTASTTETGQNAAGRQGPVIFSKHRATMYYFSSYVTAVLV